MFILSGVISVNESSVLGIFDSIEEMQAALNEWHKTTLPLSHYFFDVKQPGQPLDWTNDQQALYPT
jgi:hypothetical protein